MMPTSILLSIIWLVSGSHHSPNHRGRFRKLIESKHGNVTIPRLIMEITNHKHKNNQNESAKLFFSMSDDDDDSTTLDDPDKSYPLLSPESPIPDSPSHFQTAYTEVWSSIYS